MATATKSRKAVKSPEEQIHELAGEYIEINAAIASLNAQKEEIKARMGEWYNENGGGAFADLLQVQERATPVKITGATGKRLEMLKEQLIRELPAGYIKEQTTLDLGRMYASVDSDPALRAMLNEAGLTLEQQTSLVFKEIKD